MKLRNIVAGVALVVVLALVAAGVAVAVSSGQKKEYAATTRILFEGYAQPELGTLGPGFGIGGDHPDRRTFTLGLLVDSRTVAEQVARNYPKLGYTADQVHSQINVSSVGASDLLEITARSTSRERALALVTAYRQTFNRMRRARERRRARVAARALQSALDQLSARLRFSGIGETMRAQIGQLNVIARIGTATPIVVEDAHADSDAVSPQTKRNGLFALLFGALLGIGLIVLRSAAIAQRDRAAGAPATEPASDWE